MRRLLPGLVLVALMAAQYGALYQRARLSGILAAYGAALVGMLWLARVEPGTPPTPLPLPPAMPNARPRPLLALLAVALAGLAWLLLAGNRFTLPGTSAWVGSVLAFVGAFWRWSPREGGIPRSWRALPGVLWARLRQPQSVALLLLLALALFARLYRLAEVPPEMNSDHVEKLLDVNDVLSGRTYIFFQRNTGREPMQFYVVATIIRLFHTGLSFYSLKLSNVLMGVVAVLGSYLLGREVGGQRVGWVAGFFVAVALWPVGTSRIGLRYPFAPAFTSLSMWALWRALRTEQRNDWLVAGVLLGLGLHGYTAFRLMPVAAVGTTLLKVAVEPPRSWPALWQRGLNFALYVAVALLVFLPLGRYMVENPQMFWYRSLTRATSLEREVTDPLGWLAAQTLLRTLGMFNWVGDQVFVSTIAKAPVLDVVSSALFLMGLGYTLLVLLRQRRLLALALLLNGFLLLLPSALNFAFPLESPSVVRAGGAIPVVALLFALGTRYVYQRLRAGWGGRASAVLVGLLLGAMALINYNRYFGLYLASYRDISMNTAEVAATMEDYLSLVGDTDHMAIKGWPHWLDTRALGIQLGDVGWSTRRASMELAPLLATAPRDGKPLLYILHPADRPALRQLKRQYPAGFSLLYRASTPKHDYLFFIVPATRPVTMER